MKKLFNLILVLTFFLSTNIFAAHLNFTAGLSGLQEVPAVITSSSGTGAFTLTNAGGLNFHISVNGLSGPITGIHFHYGSLKQSGPIVKDISTPTGNTASGSWKSTDAQPLNDSLIAALMTGKIYVNVHTSANPGGEIRGQVLISSGTTLIARLDGRNEVPSVTTNGTGIGSVTLASVGGVGLVFNLSVNGLSGPITGAHFHTGDIGVNGPIVFDITNSFNGNNAAGVWRTTGANALTETLITALLTGGLYLNVHTSANPGGEIRGQLYLNAGIGMEANLDGESNVPPVTTPAKATSSLTLTDYGLVFDLTMQGLSTPINNAHFHNGDSTVNGPIVYDFRNLISNNTVKGVWKTTAGGGNLTPALLKELLDGRIYINLHTVLYPGGEVRSQIKLKDGSGITSKMTGLQEVPSVTTTASGTATMLANPTSVIYNITVNGLSGPITGAHFHLGSIKENGPIVKDISGAFTGNTAAGVWATSDPQPFNDSLRAALVAGKIYVNVHTAANPGGEIRGQVLLSAGGGLISVLEGTQEVPSVTTTAKGTTSYTLTRGGLGFNVVLNGLSGAITGAHFHFGYTGENGPIVKDITSAVNGNNITGYWRPSDAQPLNDSLMVGLLTGRIYVNVHTSANPGGEIRGQVLVNEGIGLASIVNGNQEVPPVTTNAMGTGSYTLNDAGLIFYATVTGLSGPITGMHFHNAPAGINGPIVKSIHFDNTVRGVWRRTDPEMLTTSLMNEILSNNVYMNVHTSANPGGEIRGQLFTGSIPSTGIQQISTEVPEKFTLQQNYPNPFNPTTEILFSISKPGLTVLKVYNLVGQQVATLVNKVLEVGTYQYKFNGANLSSGVYFYKLESNGLSDIKKMMIVK